MRICRFSTGEEPRFGVVTGEVDELGQPAEDSVVVPLAGDPLYVGIKLLEEHHKLSDVRLLAPIIPRSKVVGIGKNYAAHAAEMGGEVPAEPLMFLKPNTAVVGPGDPIYYPPQTSNLHYEGELAVVIGRICRDVPALVAHLSSVMTLLPGDLILTGTPAGVGPMQVGDEVEISIAGIGALTNPVSQRN